MPDEPRGNPDRFLDWGFFTEGKDSDCFDDVVNSPDEWRRIQPRLESLAGRGELKAPRPGWFRVVGVDTFEAPDADFLVGDFADKDEAIAEAKARAGTMRPYYVYTHNGALIFSAGKP